MKQLLIEDILERLDEAGFFLRVGNDWDDIYLCPEGTPEQIAFIEKHKYKILAYQYKQQSDRLYQRNQLFLNKLIDAGFSLESVMGSK